MQCCSAQTLRTSASSLRTFLLFILSCSLHTCIRAGLTAMGIDTAPTTASQLLLHRP